MFKNVTAITKQASKSILLVVVSQPSSYKASIYAYFLSIKLLTGFTNLTIMSGVNYKRIVTYSYFYRKKYVYKFTYAENDKNCTVYPDRISSCRNTAGKWSNAELYPGIFHMGSNSKCGKLPVYPAEYGKWRRVSAESIEEFGFAY